MPIGVGSTKVRGGFSGLCGIENFPMKMPAQCFLIYTKARSPPRREILTLRFFRPPPAWGLARGSVPFLSGAREGVIAKANSRL